MDCGAGNALCRIVGWLKDLGLSTERWERVLHAIHSTVLEIWQTALGILEAHGSKLVTLASLSFAAWNYRESVLHKRLAEYLAEEDQRLKNAATHAVEALFRPGPRRKFEEPLFAVDTLRSVLRRLGWNSRLAFWRREVDADRLLDQALIAVEKHMVTAGKTLRCFTDQKATALLLKGAIASARAPHTHSKAQAAAFDDAALGQFRLVLEIPEHRHNVQAQEYEAHQLRKLGDLDGAEDAYKKLEVIAATLENRRDRNLTVARSKRHRAQIAQATAPAGSVTARDFIVDAQNLRSQLGPHREWDAIEHGDVHYVGAYIRSRLHNNHRAERRHLILAAAAYGSVLSQSPPGWLASRRVKRLRSAAEGGLARVERAKAGKGYDEAWLLPPSEDA